MTKHDDVELPQDDDLVDLGEVSLNTEGDPTKLTAEGGSQVFSRDI